MMSFKKVALGIAAAGVLAVTPVAQAVAADITVAIYTTFTSLDPYDANDTMSQNVVKSFYEGLFGFDKDMKLVNVLAESWEASPDGLEYIIKLKPGVKFSDGTDFNAEAVKANFDRVTNPENHLKRYQLYSEIVKTEVVDDLTVKFTLDAPFSPFINTLAHPSAAMISKKTLDTYKGKEVGFHPCGTGPYIMTKYNPSEILQVKKNPNYWRKGYPKLDGITWKPVVENSTRAAMMQTGEAQFAVPMPAEQVKTLEKAKNVKIIVSPSIVERFVSMNMNQKPFNDKRVRHALNYAVNKKALGKVVFSSYAKPATGIAPELVDYATVKEPWPYDPKKAKALLAEAGYPNGFETTLWAAFNNTTSQKVIQFMQQQLAQVGVKVKVQALEAGQRVAQVESHQDPATAPVRMYYIGWSSSTGELDWAIRPLLYGPSAPPNMSNTAYYANPEFDKCLKEALQTTDRAKKTELYTRAQDLAWDDAPWIFLITEENISASAANLTGFHVLPDGGLEFSEAELH